MPIAAGRRCAEVGCGDPPLPGGGRCARHARAVQHADNRRRGSSTAQGYGARWRHYRAWYLPNYPLCGDRPPGATWTADSRCRADGLLVPATVVDHIVPVSGPYDERFFDERNHQSLCASCHNAKRQRERRT